MTERPHDGAGQGWAAPTGPGWAPPPGSGQPPAHGQEPGYAQPPVYGQPPAYGAGQPTGPGQVPPGQVPPGQLPPWQGGPPGWGGPPPAPKPGVVPLRPLGLGELLDGAVGVVRRYPRPTLGLSAVVAVVTTLLTIVLLALLPSGLFQGAGSSQDLTDAEVGGALVGSLGTVAVTGLAGIVLSGIITAVVGKAVLGEPMSAGEAWRAVRPRIAPLLGLALLVGLLLAAVGGVTALVVALLVAVGGTGGVVLAVPLVLAALVAAVVLYLRFSLAAPALVLERVGVRASLRRSGVLVARSYWRVLGILLLAAAIAAAVGQVIQLPFVVLGGGVGLFTGDDVSLTTLVLAQIGSGVAQMLTAPFSSGVRALLYVDRRMRAEGLDVSLHAAAAARG